MSELPSHSGLFKVYAPAHAHTTHTHTLHRCVIASVISLTVSLCAEHRFACIDQEVQLHLYHIHRRQHRQSTQSEAHHQGVSLPEGGGGGDTLFTRLSMILYAPMCLLRISDSDQSANLAEYASKGV